MYPRSLESWVRSYVVQDESIDGCGFSGKPAGDVDVPFLPLHYTSSASLSFQLPAGLSEEAAVASGSSSPGRWQLASAAN